MRLGPVFSVCSVRAHCLKFPTMLTVDCLFRNNTRLQPPTTTTNRFDGHTTNRFDGHTLALQIRIGVVDTYWHGGYHRRWMHIGIADAIGCRASRGVRRHLFPALKSQEVLGFSIIIHYVVMVYVVYFYKTFRDSQFTTVDYVVICYIATKGDGCSYGRSSKTDL